MNGPLVIAVTVIAVAAFLAARAYFLPYGPCWACTRKGRGKAGRGVGSGGRAWSKCGHCDGSGERIRLLALIWPKHRETARKLKRDRSK